jgi:nicotinate-nucleotide adenylyltransferase
MGKAAEEKLANPEPPFRLGLLGGTFDPIHIGHLRLAIEAIEGFNLDQVQLVLSSVPPHKEVSRLMAWEKRWRMLELACADTDKLRPSPIEIDRPGPSYTVDTLRQIRSGLNEKDEVFLLVGMDAANEMRTWKSHRSILALARVVVATRGKETPDEAFAEFENSIEFLDLPTLEISSTRIRNRVREGKDIRHLVPETVHRYILEQGLYRDGPSPTSTTARRKNARGSSK